jgi:hypothetical protein
MEGRGHERRPPRYRVLVDVGTLLRLKGVLEATAEPTGRPGQGEAESYPRVRARVAALVDDSLLEELGSLFPEQLSTAGRPWLAQGEEAIVLMKQLAGWLGGLIEEAVLERRIRVEAEEKAKRTGFS